MSVHSMHSAAATMPASYVTVGLLYTREGNELLMFYVLDQGRNPGFPEIRPRTGPNVVGGLYIAILIVSVKIPQNHANSLI